MSPPPKVFKPLYKFYNILIPGRAEAGRAEQNNLRAGPEISARLTPLVNLVTVVSPITY